ncbi:hypothetical protein HAX54_021745 [Datura stramonium]|uniref:Uncharacterized protein n=1 Tax=Datura stramonium TaxID=4076 RepID=A0ABS8S3Q5_DATST|nr:hypothetical protein [Datura stramonium]
MTYGSQLRSQVDFVVRRSRLWKIERKNLSAANEIYEPQVNIRQIMYEAKGKHEGVLRIVDEFYGLQITYDRLKPFKKKILWPQNQLMAYKSDLCKFRVIMAALQCIEGENIFAKVGLRLALQVSLCLHTSMPPPLK